MTLDEILSGFSRRGIARGGELLLTPGDAFEVVSKCDVDDIAVTGVEALIVGDDHTTPLPEFIADCTSASVTWREYRERANACCRSFLGQLPARHALFVSLTGLSAREWSSE